MQVHDYFEICYIAEESGWFILDGVKHDYYLLGPNRIVRDFIGNVLIWFEKLIKECENEAPYSAVNVSDFIRQTWEESRHSLMGFSRLQTMGINPYLVPIPVGHYQAYTAQPLLEGIAALTQVGEAAK
jgi:hypothetical protein